MLLAIQSNPWIKPLPSGGKVSLVAVTDPIRKTSWQPDGKRLPIWVFPETLKRMEGSATNPNQIVSFVFQLHLKNPKSFPNVAVLQGSERLPYGFVLLDAQRPGLWWAGAGKSAKKMPAEVGLRFGLADGGWKVVGRYDVRAGKATGVPFLKSLRHSPGRRRSDVVLGAVVPKELNHAYRFKVFSPSGAVTLDGRPSDRQESYYLQTGPKPPLAIEIQLRPYRWTTFSGVHPRPKA